MCYCGLLHVFPINSLQYNTFESASVLHGLTLCSVWVHDCGHMRSHS